MDNVDVKRDDEAVNTQGQSPPPGIGGALTGARCFDNEMGISRWDGRYEWRIV